MGVIHLFEGKYNLIYSSCCCCVCILTNLITSQRWRCETCDDFDLCGTCKTRVNHNQTHNFRSIKKETSFHIQENNAPDKNDTDSYESNPSQTIFICDYCDSDIVGIRHTCGACPGKYLYKHYMYLLTNQKKKKISIYVILASLLLKKIIRNISLSLV